jgi:hypothetical protein
MGCSLSAAADMQRDRDNLYQKAKNNKSLEIHFTFINDINENLIKLRKEKEELEESVIDYVFKDGINIDDTFLNTLKDSRSKVTEISEYIKSVEYQRDYHVNEILNTVDNVLESDIIEVSKRFK